MKLQSFHKFDVRVDCETFNQSSYIEDALNGFTRQQTTFPFLCVIFDDASTDGTPQLIKSYLYKYFETDNSEVCYCDENDNYVKIFAQHKSNRNCFFSVFLLKYNHYSKKIYKDSYLNDIEKKVKYFGICEGDDYWIDSSKLQKQFALMEAHPEYSMCFHANYDLYPNGEKKEYRPRQIKLQYTTEDAIRGGGPFMTTNSMFCRYDYLRKEGRPFFWEKCPIGDVPMMLYFASKGAIGYIDEVMSVYRRLSAGSWTTRKKSLLKSINHHRAIIKMFQEFDVYTNYTYHKTIYEKKLFLYRVIFNDIKRTVLKK